MYKYVYNSGNVRKLRNDVLIINSLIVVATFGRCSVLCNVILFCTLCHSILLSLRHSY